MEKRYAKIISTGRYVPKRIMTNAEFEPLVGDVDAWLKENVGIAERRVVDNETTSDMCTAAARQALERADLDPTDIDLIILGTDTPDYISPATAPILQHKLGALNSGSFDINSACASWIAGLDVAAKQITVDIDINNVLVVGGYAMTRFLDYHDKRTCTLFGDGAGAVVMSVSDEPGYLASKLISQGQYYKSWGIYTGGAVSPVNDNWPPIIRQTVAKAGLASVNEIDFLLFTQLNLNTIKDVMQRLNQPLEKTHWIMDKWGYTGAACIPMALDDALVKGKGPRPGDLVLFCASGGGFAIACAVFKW
jgi:3-oxoacyl-[acyl-carrier-protein] synthase-3